MHSACSQSRASVHLATGDSPVITRTPAMIFAFFQLYRTTVKDCKGAPQMKSKTYFTRMHSHGQLPCKSKLKSKLQYQCLPNRCWSLDVPVDVLVELLNAIGRSFGFHWMIFWKRFPNEITRYNENNQRTALRQSISAVNQLCGPTVFSLSTSYSKSVLFGALRSSKSKVKRTRTNSLLEVS